MQLTKSLISIPQKLLRGLPPLNHLGGLHKLVKLLKKNTTYTLYIQVNLSHADYAAYATKRKQVKYMISAAKAQDEKPESYLQPQSIVWICKK